MPHVIVKLWPGKTEQQKQKLADAITKDVMSILDYSADSVSVGFDEVASGDWAKEAYQPDIVAKAATLYKKPGYRM